MNLVCFGRLKGSYVYLQRFFCNYERCEKNDLYVLLGKTFVCSSNAYVNFVNDKTSLWHNKLGYIS